MRVNSVIFFVVMMQACASITGPASSPMDNPRGLSFTAMEIVPTYPTYMFLTEIWASSESNVYAVGWTTGRRGQMWRYDGNTWAEDLFLRPPSQGHAYQLMSISGSGTSDVWTVGWLETYTADSRLDSTTILQFDGTQWAEVGPRYSGQWQAIEASDPNDVWVGGTNPFIVHFDGTSWSEHLIPTEYFVKVIRRSPEGRVFSIVYDPSVGQGIESLLLEWSGVSWDVVDSNRIAPPNWRFGNSDLLATSESVVSVGTDGVYIDDGHGWFHADISTYSIRSVAGYSRANIFAGGDKGTLVHHNGSDFYEYTEISNEFDITGIALTSKSVFLLANNPLVGKSYIILGR